MNENDNNIPVKNEEDTMNLPINDEKDSSTAERIAKLQEAKNDLLGINTTEKGLVMQQPGNRQLVKKGFWNNGGYAGPLILGLITALAGILFMTMVLK